jgi:hypothetical protein
MRYDMPLHLILRAPIAISEAMDDVLPALVETMLRESGDREVAEQAYSELVSASPDAVAAFHISSAASCTSDLSHVRRHLTLLYRILSSSPCYDSFTPK